ncbi:MAG: hypothetical protein IPP71_12070 [Bacteroidetes bacterium]|nr:hypothetical protein [Bacteroidota bacterium]
MHAEMGLEPFDVRLIVKTPVSDADIDATIKGSINLANISKMVPLEAGTTLKGDMNANVTAKEECQQLKIKIMISLMLTESFNSTVLIMSVTITSKA